MVRNYKRLENARKYKDYEGTDNLQMAVDDYRADLVTYEEAERIYGVPRKTISNKVRQLHMGCVGHPRVYTEEEEEELAKELLQSAGQGVKITATTVKAFIKAFNNASGKLITQFIDGEPGDDWTYAFLHRHPELKSSPVQSKLTNYYPLVKNGASRDDDPSGGGLDDDGPFGDGLEDVLMEETVEEVVLLAMRK